MDLEELKLRLDIAVDDTSNDDRLTLMLEDAIDFVRRICGREFDPLPPTVKSVITKFVQYEYSGMNDGVVSESIGGMSQTFGSKEERDRSLTDELRRARLIRMKFTP